MNYDTKEIMGYLYLKGALSLIYSNNFSESFDFFNQILDIDDDYLLIIIKEYLNIWNDSIDINMKNNIYSLIQILRNNLVNIEDKNRVIFRSETMNEIICCVNNANDVNMEKFIFDELRYRYSSIFMATKILVSIPINELKQYIEYCIQDDFYLLLTHSNILSDEEFDSQIRKFADKNIDYILNINCFLNEFPELFQDEIFKNRVLKVLNILKLEIGNETISLFGKANVQPKKVLTRLEKNLEKYKL